MELLVKVFLLIIFMLIINVRNFTDLYCFERKHSKAWYIISNVVAFLVFFYMIFLWQGGVKLFW